jgi:hypothetical protein
VRPVENSPHATERDTHAAASSLADLGAGGPQQSVYVAPPKVGWCRLGKNPS